MICLLSFRCLLIYHRAMQCPNERSLSKTMFLWYITCRANAYIFFYMASQCLYEISLCSAIVLWYITWQSNACMWNHRTKQWLSDISLDKILHMWYITWLSSSSQQEQETYEECDTQVEIKRAMGNRMPAQVKSRVLPKAPQLPLEQEETYEVPDGTEEVLQSISDHF